MNTGYIKGFQVILWSVAIAWVLEIIDYIPLLNLDHFGVRPRNLSSLFNILLMPWLHGGIKHLIANTVPFVTLASLVFITEKQTFHVTTLKLILISGFGTWLIGRPNSVHIGASALVYGYFGYLIMKSYVERKFTWFLLGCALLFLYGHLIFGALPSFKGHVSWEGHLSGLVGGLWLARTSQTKKHASS